MAPSPLICGIDIGTTNVKVLLIDDTARTLWSRSIPVPRTDDAGRPATNARALVATLEQLIIEGWRATGASAPITALATTGIGEDGLPVNSRLEPLDVSIPWFDRRAEADAEALRPQLDQPISAGVPLDGTRTAAKWRWLRRQRPEVLRDSYAWIALTDYPSVWWSRTPFLSETLAARTACYDVFARRWLASHLEAAAAPPLPKVVCAGTVVGTLSPGPLVDSGAASTRTLIVAGGHDHPVAASVVRRIDPTAIVDSLGTANLVYGETADDVPRADPYIAFSVPALGGPGVACLGVYEFAASLDPFRALGGGTALRDFLAADVAPGAPGDAASIARYLRRILSAAEPVDASTWTADGRMLIEAGCFYARRMLEAARSAGCGAGPVYSVGGWARSTALMELRASVLGEPVITVDEDELTALGAALLASDAVAPGAEQPLRRRTRVVRPRQTWQARYADLYTTVGEAWRSVKEH